MRGGCFAEALQRGELPRITRAIANVVARSMVSHPMRGLGSQAEAKRRSELCANWFRTMVEEHRFGVDRALSELGSMLRATCEGRDWAPNVTSVLWVPDAEIIIP